MISFEHTSLKNFKIKIAYDGNYFNGWQRHYPGDNSVEDVISNSIEKIIGENVVLIAASRTDKGVHACEQILNFRTLSDISPIELKNELRKKLEYIYILSVEEAPLFFHSRRNSLGKKYVYQIWNFRQIKSDYKKYCWHLKEKLDLNKMIEYSFLFKGKRDFKIFTREKQAKNTIRTIFEINIKKIKELILIEITGDSFLYNMVRSIVANIVALTYQKIKPSDLIEQKSEFIIAPPEGLFLDRIYY